MMIEQEFQEKLNNILDNSKPSEIDEESVSKAKEFFQIFAQSKQSKQSKNSQNKQLQNETDDPCIEMDCSDILSPCCASLLENNFGTIPLEVICKNCKKSYLLRDLLKTLKQNGIV